MGGRKEMLVGGREEVAVGGKAEGTARQALTRGTLPSCTQWLRRTALACSSGS